MRKANWPDHPAVGLTIAYDDGTGPCDARIVDVRSGPMLAKIALGDTHFDLSGTLLMKLKIAGRGEFWTPPCDGKKLVEWAEKQRSPA